MLHAVLEGVRDGADQTKAGTRVIGSVLRTIVVAVAIMVGAGLLANAKITINIDHLIQPLETIILDETDAMDGVRTTRGFS